MDINAIRTELLQRVADIAPKGPGYFQQSHILGETASRLKISNDLALQQVLLTCWHDLFRNGQLSWGYDLSNPNPPFCHITEIGRKTLQNCGRDPANPAGYIAYLSSKAAINPISESYIKEALTTYNSNCFKATAVMVGGAAESVILELRDCLTSKMASLSKNIPKALEDWRVKVVLNALEAEFAKCTLPKPLHEAFGAFWPAFTHQIRVSRNDAGHPTSIDPVTPDAVHASLLIFPEIAKLGADLKNWVTTSYV